MSRVDGDTDGDGDLDEIFGFGARSFSIWSSDGDLIFDSGDDFEQITAQALPNNFNAAEDENDRDNRSDDRGPEPEVVAVGTIAGRHYAFVGVERISGIFVYDITNPSAPSFEQYINNRNFGVDPGSVCGSKGGVALPTCGMAGDLETEGVTFIPASQSPIGEPMLAVSHELSDSTTFYQIDLVSLTGDFNNDGIVSAADYTVWRDNNGLAVTLPNDQTPGTVDQSDYIDWKNNFGLSVGSGASQPTTIPEPGSMLLLMVFLSIGALVKGHSFQVGLLEKDQIRPPFAG